MPWQNFDPKTGVQTTYKGETADTGVAKVEQISQPTNPNFQPTPAPSAAAPAAAPAATTTPAPSSSTSADTSKTGVDTNAPVEKNKDGLTMDQANSSENWYKGKYAPGINNLVASGRAFNETDAKNFASANGDANWQQYVGGTGGNTNPLYIGSTNWSKLQKQYTPYQLSQATFRNKDGIYWNDKVNIGEIQREDPSKRINSDTKKLADIITEAKTSANKMTKEDTTKNTVGIGDTANETQDNIAQLYQDNPGAEALYKELYNSPEMKAAQEDVAKYKKNNDEYDQQLDDLKDDIRAEVEGEAPESYINALAAVRGDKILKLKRANQRDLDAATSQLTNIKENAGMLLQTRVKDADTRYNQLFQMLQLQIQQEGNNFNRQTALANIQMNLPENRSITIDGTTYKGLKENDNLNVIQFTEKGGKTYVIGVDKKTGKEMYKQLIGTAREPSSGGSGTTTAVKQLAEYNAQNELTYAKEMDAKVKSGAVGVGYDDKGNSFYYDKAAYDAAYKDATTGWNMWKTNPDKIDFRL